MRPAALDPAVVHILQVVPGTFDVISFELVIGILEMNNHGRVLGNPQRARLSVNVLAKLEPMLQ